MTASSQVYENAIIGFRLEAPGDWKLQSWKSGKIDKSSHTLFQRRDDDLPVKTGSSKFIVVACRYEPGSNIRVECDIETSLSRQPPRYDFLAVLLGNLAATSEYYRTCGIEGDRVGHGDWTIGELQFGFVDQKNASQWGTSRYRFVFRPLNETLWFYAKIAGHSEQAYADAIGAFATIQLATSLDEPITPTT